MKQKTALILTSLIGMTTISGNAFAFATPVAEPGIVSLLGLGAVVTILVVRYFRR